MLILVLVIGIVAATAIGTLEVMKMQNAKLAKEAERAEVALQASYMLKHAIGYLEPLGPGANLEWANARTILELAMMQVLYSK